MRWVLVAAMAAVLSTSAKAQVGVDEFRQICVENRADRVSVLAAADKAGWMPMPKPMLDKFPSGQFKDPDARMRSTKEAVLILLVGHGKPTPKLTAELQICGVAAIPPGADSFEQAAAEISGVEKFGDSSSGLFFWREDAGKHSKIDMTEMQAALEMHNLNLIVTHRTDKMAMIMFATPTPTSSGTH